MAGPDKRRYLLSGLLTCGMCGRRMESAWSNGKPAYRCRHGHTTASAPGPDRAGNAYIREERILRHLPAVHLLLTGPAGGTRRRRTRRGTDVRPAASPREAIGYLRANEIVLTYDQATGNLLVGATGAAKTTVHLTRQAAADSRARNRDHGHGHALGSLSVALPERDAR